MKVIYSFNFFSGHYFSRLTGSTNTYLINRINTITVSHFYSILSLFFNDGLFIGVDDSNTGAFVVAINGKADKMNGKNIV